MDQVTIPLIGQFLSNSATISNLSPGLYVAKVQDNTSSYCSTIKYFLVGEECKETTVNIQMYDNLMEDLSIYQANQYGNYGSYTYNYTGRYNNNNWETHLKYQFGGLDDVLANSVEFSMYENVVNIPSEDKLYLKRVTPFYWNESLSNWASIKSTAPVVTSNHEMVENQTNIWSTDLLSAFNDYKSNPSNGLQFFTEIKDIFPLTTGSYWYTRHFSSLRSGSYGYQRPKLTIKFNVPVCPEYAAAELKDRYDGSYYQSHGEKFIFHYREEYETNVISFNVYDWDNELIATQADFALPTIQFGQNTIELDLVNNPGSVCFSNGIYSLEVVNGKGEKSFLRFIHNNSTCP